MSETKCWECGTTENVRPIRLDHDLPVLGCTSCFPPKAAELEDAVKRHEAEKQFADLAVKAGRIANAQDAATNHIEEGQLAYEKLSLSASDGDGCYLTGKEVKAIVGTINLLIESRERTITRMEECIGRNETPHPSVPLINAKQVISLLSLTWPDGNYSN